MVTWRRVGPSEARFPAGAKDLPLLRNVQTGSGAHLVSYSLSGIKGGEGEFHHPRPFSTEIKNECI
jgi:hypothetical protein